MSRDYRRLFKRPRNILRWPLGAYGLIGLLVAVVVLVAIGAVLILPPEIPPPQTASADRWAAEGAAFGGGAFLLAVLATAIAVIAYVNSTERPALRLEAEYPGRDEPLAINWNNSAPDESGQITSSGERMGWSLNLRIHNDGPVAARFVAIQVTFGQGAHLELKGRRPDLRPWLARSDRLEATDYVRWEGGADAVVHPSWTYPVPQLGDTYLIMSGPQPQTAFTFDVEVVADDVAAFTTTYTIKVPRDK